MAKKSNIDGKTAYDCAIALTDKHGQRFCDMLTSDYRGGVIERRYFLDEWEEFPVCGWQTFCREMLESGQGDWLEKINALDEAVMVKSLERQLLEYQRDGNKEGVDLCVKALGGIVSKKKIDPAGDKSGGSDKVIQIFITGEKGVSEDGEN